MMLRFTSHDAEGPTDSGSLHHAILIDKDEMVVAGKIRTREGIIECLRRGSGATAMSLMYDAGEPGELSLRTCLLPPRDAPYVLSVELARHRIAMFVHKAEEWMMVDLDDTHPAMRLWEEARRLFTTAMVTSDRAKADQAGHASLALAIRASERLAIAHAEILLKRRFRAKPAPSTSIGVRIDPSRSGEALRELAKRHFRLLAIPLRWDRLCPEEGAYRWEQTDDWIAWAEDNGCRVLGGPLIDLGRHGLPGWVASRAVSYEHLRDLAYEHVEQVVARYGDHLGMWSIGTGFNTNTTMSLKPKEMIDLARTLALRVREGHRGRRVIIEVEQPWSEFIFKHPDALPPAAFLEQLTQAGIRLDGVGLRLQFGDGEDGRSMRDLMEISRLLDRYILLDLRVLVTDLGVPSLDVAEGGGRWRDAWTETLQSQWTNRAIPMLLSKPHVESVIWTDLFDHEDTRPRSAGLISERGSAKEVLKQLVGWRRKLSKPLGPLPPQAS
ncbi:MAG: endo-1,4-beta-xylanase [Phycisphaerales bacterium]|jgi:hypothetical protein|nr:endo-1,4-beta-xylanase [Phycisphaerales bacterium]